jgi:hypothetical protein
MIRRLFLKLFRRRRLDRDLETELAFHREISAVGGNPIPLGNAIFIKEQAFEFGASTASRIFGGTSSMQSVLSAKAMASC